MGIPAKAIPRTSSGQAITGPGVLKGAVLCGGADAATATLRDGTDNTGAVLGKLGVGAGLSAALFPPDGIAFTAGLYIEVNTGTTPQVVAYL